MKTVPLSIAAKIIMGQSPPSETYNKDGRGLPFFQGKADFGEMYPKVRMYCNAPKKIANEGDILISVRAPVGPTNINSQKSCIGRGLAAIRSENGSDAKYLLYFLRYYEPKLARLSKGSTFDAIGKDDLAKIPIPLPPLPEQQRIAALLDKADRVRRLRRYARELSDSYLQAVFLEMFGDPVENPRGWETGKLNDLCEKVVDCPHETPEVADGITPYACIRSSDIQNGFLDWSTTRYLSEDEYLKRIIREVPMAGDIFYCREGARLGNAARIPEGKTVCLGQRMMMFRAKPGVSTSEFIWGFLETKSTYQQAMKIVGGSASPHINVKDIKAFYTIIPPLPLQEKFACAVQHYERLRAQQREAERQAEMLFGSLLALSFAEGLERAFGAS